MDAPVPADTGNDPHETEDSTGDQDGAKSGTVEESLADDTDDGSSSETEGSTGDQDGAKSGTVEESPVDDAVGGSSSETAAVEPLAMKTMKRIMAGHFGGPSEEKAMKRIIAADIGSRVQGFCLSIGTVVWSTCLFLFVLLFVLFVYCLLFDIILICCQRHFDFLQILEYLEYLNSWTRCNGWTR